MSRSEDRLGALYTAYSRDALRLATALTGNESLAADIVQTAFVRLLARFRDIRQPESFHFYLRKTIVNLARDSARRSALEAAFRRRSLAAVSASSEMDASGRIDSHHHLLGLMRALPRRQQVVLVLRYFEDMSVDETASIMGISVSAVKSMTNRAVSKLRDSYEEEK